MGEEESKEESKAPVPKKPRKKPVRNKTKVVEAVPGLDMMGGELDEEMKQAMIIAAMADAADEELGDGEEKEESDVYLNTKDLRDAMAGLED